MIALLLLINALVAIAMIILILLQRTDASGGGVFGGSAGNAPVVRNPLARPTAYLAGVFLVLSIAIAWLGHQGAGAESTVMNAPVPPAAGTPGPQALPAPGATGAVSATGVVAPASIISPTPLAPAQAPSPSA